MANVSALSPQLNREDSTCVCVIETPKNSRRKYKFDEASGPFKLAYVLPEGMNFPFDFGFVPSTRAEDGDPLNVMVIADEPGCVGTLGWLASFMLSSRRMARRRRMTVC